MYFSAYYRLRDIPIEIHVLRTLKCGLAIATTANNMLAKANAEWFYENGLESNLDKNSFPSKAYNTHL